MDSHIDRVQRAVTAFRCPPRHLNCAQTICAAFDREDLVENLKGCNVGRAPGGTCGALYAAVRLAPAHERTLRETFRANLGAETCAELKAVHRAPCRDCVACAATALTELDRNRSAAP